MAEMGHLQPSAGSVPMSALLESRHQLAQHTPPDVTLPNLRSGWTTVIASASEVFQLARRVVCRSPNKSEASHPRLAPSQMMGIARSRAS